jgi:hypothetical protein
MPANTQSTERPDADGRIRRVIRRLPAIFTLLVIVGAIPKLGAISHVAGLWWQGQLTDDAVIGHLSVRAWGRIGKVLQLIGGAAVAIDIIGPKRFYAWSNALDGRHRDILRRFDTRSAAYPLGALRKVLSDSIVHEVNEQFGTGEYATVRTRMVITDSGPPSPRSIGPLSPPIVAAWHRATHDALPSAHTCPTQHMSHDSEACGQQTAFLKKAVDEFLQQNLSAEDWALLNNSGDQALAAREQLLMTTGILLGVGSAWFAIVTVASREGHKSGASTFPWALILYSILILIGGYLFFLSTYSPSNSRRSVVIFRFISSLQTMPAVWLARLVASALERAPSNTVKWLAFWGITVGFGLDILAS